jgi:hypothetical protein
MPSATTSLVSEDGWIDVVRKPKSNGGGANGGGGSRGGGSDKKKGDKSDKGVGKIAKPKGAGGKARSK